MLLIVIPSLWLLVAAFFVILCRGAGRADGALAGHADVMLESTRVPASTEMINVRRSGVTLYEGEGPRGPRMRWSERARARAVRGREERSAARS
jgi:hypothetical protein